VEVTQTDVEFADLGEDGPLFVVKRGDEVIAEGGTVEEFIEMMKSKTIDPKLVREIFKVALDEEE